MASIVDYLKSKNQDASFQNRAKLAKQYGIQNYKGSVKQNTDLLKFLQSSSATNNTNVSDEEIEQALANQGTSDIVVTPVKKVNPDYNNQVWNYMSHFRDSKAIGNGVPTKEEAIAALEKYGKYLTPEQRGIFANQWDLPNGITDKAAGQQAMERQARNNFEQNAAYQVQQMALNGIPLTDQNLRKYIKDYDTYWTPDLGSKLSKYAEDEIGIGTQRVTQGREYNQAKKDYLAKENYIKSLQFANDVRNDMNKAAGVMGSLAYNVPLNTLSSGVATLYNNVAGAPSDYISGEQFINRLGGYDGGPLQMFGQVYDDNGNKLSNVNTGNGVVNFLGNVVTDPLTYITGGANKLAGNVAKTTLEATPGLLKHGAYGIEGIKPLTVLNTTGKSGLRGAGNATIKNSGYSAGKIMENGRRMSGHYTQTGANPKGKGTAVLPQQAAIPQEVNGVWTKSISAPAVFGGAPSISLIPNDVNMGVISNPRPEWNWSYTPKTKILTVGGYQGSPEFQTAFGNARKQGLSEFTFGGKRYNTGLGNGGTQDVEVKDVRGMTEYLPISSGVLNYDNTAVPALGAGYKGGVGLRSQYPMHKQGGKINYINLFS